VTEKEKGEGRGGFIRSVEKRKEVVEEGGLYTLSALYLSSSRVHLPRFFFSLELVDTENSYRIIRLPLCGERRAHDISFLVRRRLDAVLAGFDERPRTAEGH
jgi:hypothetical protein